MNNPFDQVSTADAKPSGLVGSAIGAPAPGAPAGNGATPQYGTQPAPDVERAAYTGYNVDQATGTAEGRINSILKGDSGLMQRARAQAMDTAAGRGLVNSSMAVGAAQGAMIDRAAPIATADAGFINDAAKSNAAGSLQASIANANSANSMTEARLRESGAASRQTEQLTHDTTESGLQRGFTAAEAAKARDATAALQTTLQDKDAASRRSLQDAAGATQEKLAGLDAANRMALQNADATTRKELQDTQIAAQKELAKIESEFKNGLQASSSMTSTYQSMIDSVTRIMADPNLDGPGKQAAIDHVTTLYRGALDVQHTITGVNIGGLLDFATPGDNPATTPGGRQTTQPVDQWPGVQT